MRNSIAVIIAVASVLLAAVTSGGEPVIQLSEHVSFVAGPVNGVSIEKDDVRLVIYGDPAGTIESAKMVLFTHSRRDVVWAGQGLVERGATAVVPDDDVGNFTNVEKFWNDFTTRRFHTPSRERKS